MPGGKNSNFLDLIIPGENQVIPYKTFVTLTILVLSGIAIYSWTDMKNTFPTGKTPRNNFH